MGSEIRDLIGTPFQWGGRDPSTGLDCYGLVMEWFRRARGLELEDVEAYDPSIVQEDPFSTRQAPGAWEPVIGEHFQEGDVLVFRHGNGQEGSTHCGVLMADSRVLHTAEGHGAVLTPLRRMLMRLMGGYRRV